VKISLLAIVATWRGLSNLPRPGCRRRSLERSVSPSLCRFIANHCGILSAFYFLAGTVFIANLLVMAIRKEVKESSGLVQERL